MCNCFFWCVAVVAVVAVAAVVAVVAVVSVVAEPHLASAVRR